MSTASGDMCGDDDDFYADIDIDAIVAAHAAQHVLPQPRVPALGGDHAAEVIVVSDDDEEDSESNIRSAPRPRPSPQQPEPLRLAISAAAPRKPTGRGSIPATGRGRDCAGTWREVATRYGLRQGQRLHAWQVEVLQGWQSGHDTLVLSGTGSGKSLCFQAAVWLLPDRALAQKRPRSVVVVVSPLIALMRDQCAQIARAARFSACFLGSAQKDTAVEPAAMAGFYDAIYVCPETLSRLAEKLGRLHKAKGIKLLAVDEAHCCSQWGHDFRPAYKGIKDVLRRIEGLAGLGAAGAIPTMALTATATKRVRDDIRGLLFRDAATAPAAPLSFVNTFARPNLTFLVRARSQRAVVQDLQPWLNIGGASTPCSIIYVPTRKDTEKIATELRGNGGARVAAFHAGLPRKQLEQVQHNFLHNALDVVVATVAFGLGINKPNVRNVIHYGWPQSLAQYFQEAGRAGRDGQPANCVLFVPLLSLPKLLPPSFGTRSAEQTLHCLRALEAVHVYALRGHTCREVQLLAYFGEAAPPGPCSRCDACTGSAPGCAPITLECVLQFLRICAAESHGREATQQQPPPPPQGKRSGDTDGASGRWVARCCRESHGRPLSYWRGLARVLRDSTPPYIVDAAATPEAVLKACAAGPKDYTCPWVCQPRLTTAGLALLADPTAEEASAAVLALRAEADMVPSQDGATSAGNTGTGGWRRGRKRQRGASDAVAPAREHWAKRKFGYGRGGASRQPRKCYQCGEVGHRKRDCPQLPHR